MGHITLNRGTTWLRGSPNIKAIYGRPGSIQRTIPEMDVPRLYIENVLWGGCTCVLWCCFYICLAGEHSLMVLLLVLKMSDKRDYRTKRRLIGVHLPDEPKLKCQILMPSMA